MNACFFNKCSLTKICFQKPKRKKEKKQLFFSFFFFFGRRLLRLLRSLNNCFDYRITCTQCIPTCLTGKLWLSTGKNQGNTSLRPPKVCVRIFLRRGGKRMSIYRKNSSYWTRWGKSQDRNCRQLELSDV